MADDHLPVTDYSCHFMGSYPVFVHSIRSSFFSTCPCISLRHLLGLCITNPRPRHGGICFLTAPPGPISSWIPCPTDPLLPSSSDPEYGYGYQDCRSTAGIFCHLKIKSTDPIDFFCMSPMPPRPGPFLSSLPFDRSQTIICSSTCGLVLFRDRTSAYHIINPFILSESRDRYLPRPPSIHHPNDPAVLVLDQSKNQYYVACAVSDGRGTYRFDVFSSHTGRWTPRGVTLHNYGFEINSTTGVSCGSMAYWVATGNMEVVVRYDVLTGVVGLLKLPCSVQACGVQLGRVGEYLGLVIVKQNKVELYMMAICDLWTPFGFLNVNIGGGGPTELWGNLIACRSMPVPIRFESFKLQVLLWIDEELVLWESNDRWMTRTRLVQLPGNSLWGNERVNSDSVAYVHSSYLPGFQGIINGDSEQQHFDTFLS